MDPDTQIKVEKVESPAPSCLSVKSDWSMDRPLNFKREGLTPELRVKQERVESPPPSCLSVKSDWSMDRPLNFKRESWTPEFSEFSSSLLSEDHFRCSVCSEGLKEPVSIACGHSYCRQCISTYWAQPSHAGDYQCPQCSKSFPTRPELSTNTALVRVLHALQQAGFSPVLPAVAHAGPGDVACDICCGPKVRAVKTCVTCSASYCESHVRQHYTVPALQRHTLTEVTGDQRHTHQQDSVKKMEIIKQEISLKQQKEEEEIGQSPRTRKMQLKEEEDTSKGSSDELKSRDRELELENAELNNICSKLSDKTAPSCVFMKSDESMEPPLHFGLEETISGSGIHEEGLESRPPSFVSMKSDWSMDPPLHFKQEGLTPELRVKQERVESPAPSCLSVKSDRSMDPPPLHFKRESWTPEFSEFSSSLLSEDHFRCSVCSEGLKEPVSIACGHSYCRQCISTYWARPSHAGDYQCPQCSKSFPTRPELSTNTALVRVLQALQQAGFSPVLPAVAHAGPGDVACDICCGPKPRAVKTCVTCSASYCESHVRQHYTVPALQRHTLTHVTGDQRHTHQQDRVKKMRIIEEEKEPMEGEMMDACWRKKRSRDDEEETRKESSGEEAKGEFEEGKKKEVDTEKIKMVNDLDKHIEELQRVILDLREENSVLKTAYVGLQQKSSQLNSALKNGMVIFGASEEENTSKHRSILCADCGQFKLEHRTRKENNSQENDGLMADGVVEKHGTGYKTLVETFSRLTTNLPRLTDAERECTLDLLEAIIPEECSCPTLVDQSTNSYYQPNLFTPPTLVKTNERVNELLRGYAQLQMWSEMMESRYRESVMRHRNLKADLSSFRYLLQSYMNLLPRASGSYLFNPPMSPFRLESLKQWSEVKQRELQFLDSLGRLLPFSMMVSKQELHKYVTEAEMVSTVCFTLTSSSNKDEYLLDMENYLANLGGSQRSAKPLTQPRTAWSGSLMSKVRHKLQTFLEFMKVNETLKFMAAAIEDEPLPGASIRLYQGGSLVDADYEPVTKPPSAVVTAAKPTSLTLKLPTSRTGDITQLLLAFRPNRTEEFFPYQEKWSYITSYSPTVDIANLITDTPYEIRHSAMDRVGKSQFSTVITGRTLLGASPGRPLVHSLDGRSVRLTWKEPAQGSAVAVYHLQLSRGKDEWDNLVTTEVEKKISPIASSAGVRCKARVCAVNACYETSCPSEETVIPLAADVILDPDTAHRSLVLSDNGRKVKLGGDGTVSPHGYDRCPRVLAREGFTSGRHFWNVEVDKEWTVGVTVETARRQGPTAASPGNGYWCVDSWSHRPALNGFGKLLPRPPKLKVLGVCLDVDERWVSFYNAETRVHICTYTGMAFRQGEKIYPLFEVLQRKSKGLVIQAIQ